MWRRATRLTSLYIAELDISLIYIEGERKKKLTRLGHDIDCRVLYPRYSFRLLHWVEIAPRFQAIWIKP